MAALWEYLGDSWPHKHVHAGNGTNAKQDKPVRHKNTHPHSAPNGTQAEAVERILAADIKLFESTWAPVEPRARRRLLRAHTTQGT